MGRTSTAKQRLVETGKTLIGSRGFQSVGVAELCDQAGVKKGSFYYFFPSKSELAVAVINSFWRDFEASLGNSLALEGSPLDRIDEFLDQIFRRHRDTCAATARVNGCLLGNLTLEMSATDDAVRLRLAEAFKNFADQLTKTIAQAIDDGELPQGDAHLLAEQLVAYTEGMILLAKADNDATVIDRLRGGAFALLGYTGRKRRRRVRNRTELEREEDAVKGNQHRRGFRKVQ